MGITTLTHEPIPSINSSAGYTLFVTPKIEIFDNKILLPSKPEGAMVINMAFVYDEKGVDNIFKKMTVEHLDTQFFACFDDTASGIDGMYAEVCYLTSVVA